MTVERDDLERCLSYLERRMGDRRAGIYGPGSLSWQVNREGVTMLGGGCAALMQLAHPWVAHAIDQHSQTRTDPAGRFQRTFSMVFAMVFGDLDDALRSAREVHALHRTIRGAIKEDVGRFKRGDRYHANDEQALLWVHATLLDTALRVYELIVRPLSPLEREAYYQESKLFAYLFGLGDDVLPPDHAAFVRWYQDMINSETIAVGEPAMQTRRFLLSAPSRASRPLMRWMKIFTTGLLPAKLRTQFELPYGGVERALFQRSIPLLRAAHRASPERLKFYPAYVDANRRLAGKSTKDPVGQWLERAAMRGLARAPR